MRLGWLPVLALLVTGCAGWPDRVLHAGPLDSGYLVTVVLTANVEAECRQARVLGCTYSDGQRVVVVASASHYDLIPEILAHEMCHALALTSTTLPRDPCHDNGGGVIRTIPRIDGGTW